MQKLKNLSQFKKPGIIQDVLLDCQSSVYNLLILDYYNVLIVYNVQFIIEDYYSIPKDYQVILPLSCA